ncbi:MAG: VOC family protein [Deltaproteobacteria bacterium]|nr:VOC family protein [Deltaproteobacteria bacterium]
MDLAKPHIDVGIVTDRLEPMLAFWQKEVGLPFESLLPIGQGLRQHRHGMNGSVFKLNHSRDPLEEAPIAGYRELRIARAGLAERRELVDPDGNRVVLVPRGEQQVEGISLHLHVRDQAAFHDFYGRMLGLARVAPAAYRCGDSILSFEPDGSATTDPRFTARGYRYFTIQIRDVDAEHRAILERGGREGRPPVTLGTVARVSFVRDPDGNWIELSQRASLTGPLPPGASDWSSVLPS